MCKIILAAVNEQANSKVAARYAMEPAKSAESNFYTCHNWHVAEKESGQRPSMRRKRWHDAAQENTAARLEVFLDKFPTYG